MKATLETPTENYIGRYARSVESGWLGKVIAMEGEGIDRMCKMVGVNELCSTIKGGDIEDHLEMEDVQYFTPDDLKFLKLV